MRILNILRERKKCKHGKPCLERTAPLLPTKEYKEEFSKIDEELIFWRFRIDP